MNVDLTQNPTVKTETADYTDHGRVISPDTAQAIASWYLNNKRPALRDFALLGEITDSAVREINAIIVEVRDNDNADAPRELTYLAALRAFLSDSLFG